MIYDRMSCDLTLPIGKVKSHDKKVTIKVPRDRAPRY